MARRLGRFKQILLLLCLLRSRRCVQGDEYLVCRLVKRVPQAREHPHTCSPLFAQSICGSDNVASFPAQRVSTDHPTQNISPRDAIGAASADGGEPPLTGPALHGARMHPQDCRDFSDREHIWEGGKEALDLGLIHRRAHFATQATAAAEATTTTHYTVAI